MKKRRLGIGITAVWLSLAVASAPALGDGGTLRFSGRRGDRSITVFTAPAVLSVGPIDVSVLLLEAETGRPITDVPIEVRAGRVDSGEFEIRMPATMEAATNKLFPRRGSSSRSRGGGILTCRWVGSMNWSPLNSTSKFRRRRRLGWR